MSHILAILLAYAASALGVEPASELPSVEVLPKAELAAELNAGANAAADDALEPAALYDPLANRIRISDDLDLESPVGRSYLLHELVHHLQFAHGQDADNCVGRLEAEAYRVQARYLREHDFQEEANRQMILGLLLDGCERR